MVKVRVPGKVNLALAVGPVRADGYHELGTVFQAVSLFDELTALPAARGEFRLSLQGEGADVLPADEDNLAMRAARLLAAHATEEVGVAIQVRKRIPVAGGMAGGSADAAAALVACNELWQLGLSQPQLHDLARQLGADVPFLLHGGTAIGTDRGDRIESVAARGRCHWVLALSHHGLATPAVFREFDRTASPGPVVISPELLAALETGDVARVGGLLRNDLQEPAIRLLPALGEVLDEGRDAGALGALVSGSGPTAAFLCSDADQAAALGRRLVGIAEVREVQIVHGPVPGAQIIAEEVAHG